MSSPTGRRTTLASLFESKASIERFRAFMKENYAEENVSFYETVEALRARHNGDGDGECAEAGGRIYGACAACGRGVVRGAFAAGAVRRYSVWASRGLAIRGGGE